MAPEAAKNSTILIVVAIIGVIGTITATTIGAVANYNIEKERQNFELTRLAWLAIETRGAATKSSLETAIAEPTGTPYPTNTLQPTYTPYPTYTDAPPPPTVQENTGLGLGDWYSEGNISATIMEFGYPNRSDAEINLIVKNISANTITFEYSGFNFLLRDNLGNTYLADTYSSMTVLTLDAGDMEDNLSPGDCCGIFFKDVNYASPDVTEFTFVIQDLSSIKHAEWKMPVSH